MSAEFFTKKQKKMLYNSADLFIGQDDFRFNLLYIFIIIYALYYIISIFRYAHTVNVPSIILIMRRDNLLDTTPFNIKIGSYSYTFSYIFLLYCLLFKKIRKFKLRFVFLLICVMFITVVSASKSAIIQFFICIFFGIILRKKMKLKLLLPLFIITIAFLYYVTINRDRAYLEDENALLKYAYIYLLSPLPAFDYLLTDYRIPIDSNNHLAFFAFFFRVVNRLNLNIDIPEFKGLVVYVPYQTNVYTLVGSIYWSYRYLGIPVFGILYGVIYGILYEKGIKKNNEYYKMLYSLFIFDLIMQFFGETLISFLSITIQQMLISFLLTKKLVLYTKK
jgi:oligosaccharide repeat unit polymerase